MINKRCMIKETFENSLKLSSFLILYVIVFAIKFIRYCVYFYAISKYLWLVFERESSQLEKRLKVITYKYAYKFIRFVFHSQLTNRSWCFFIFNCKSRLVIKMSLENSITAIFNLVNLNLTMQLKILIITLVITLAC